MHDHEHFAYWLSPETTSSAITEHIRHHNNDQAYSTYGRKLKEFIVSSAARLNEEGTRLQDGCSPIEYHDVFCINLSSKLMYHHGELHIRFLGFDGGLGIDALAVGDSFMIDETRNIESKSCPYRFGQIVEIFNVFIRRNQTRKRESMDALFVRWYEVETPSRSESNSESKPSGASELKSHANTQPVYSSHSPKCPGRLRFLPANREGAFGFLKPSDILRKIEVVPDIAHGHTISLLGTSVARFGSGKHNSDYNYYKIECMADHDVYSRLHSKPANYRLLRALESPVLQYADVVHVVPAFVFADDELYVDGQQMDTLDHIAASQHFSPTESSSTFAFQLSDFEEGEFGLGDRPF